MYQAPNLHAVTAAADDRDRPFFTAGPASLGPPGPPRFQLAHGRRGAPGWVSVVIACVAVVTLVAVLVVGSVLASLESPSLSAPASIASLPRVTDPAAVEELQKRFAGATSPDATDSLVVAYGPDSSHPALTVVAETSESRVTLGRADRYRAAFVRALSEGGPAVTLTPQDSSSLEPDADVRCVATGPLDSTPCVVTDNHSITLVDIAGTGDVDAGQLAGETYSRIVHTQ